MRKLHPAENRVILLHGLWMHAPAMRWFAARLEGCGFDARVLGYYSVMEGSARAVARVADALGRSRGSHVVAHSLGGLMALEAVRGMTSSDIGRVVCLGTPLAGSRAAGGIVRRLPAGRCLLGRHAPMLLAGVGSLPPGVDVGMIAGSRRRGLGRLMAPLGDDHDGTVAVAETWLEGLADHVVLPASHSGLIFSDAAVRQAAAFLRTGHFEHGTGMAGAGIA